MGSKKYGCFAFLMNVFIAGMLVPVQAFALPTSSASTAALHSTALVYQGPGACDDDCAEAAAAAAKLAGLKPIMVGPKTKHVPFASAKVWIQPGGYSQQAYEAMTPRLRQQIIQFIKNGGGYVGFCAGAFLTTELIGTTGTPGLGIFPAKTRTHEVPAARAGLDYSIQKVNWLGEERMLYFKGGPALYGLKPGTEIVATYEDGSVAAARAELGKGRVFVSGPHPEAPAWWWEDDGIQNPDGIDHFLAVEMIRWAAKI
jgi:hypothetical protein